MYLVSCYPTQLRCVYLVVETEHNDAMLPREPTSRKAKLFSSRTIRTEGNDASVRNDVLNASEFITSREFEIRAFELSQFNTKSASSSRIFQSLPRTLRRRTASHNVKRIPKRLRTRALREMQLSGISDKTSMRPTGRELYKLRMKKKLLSLARKLRDLKMPVSVKGSFRDRFKTLNLQLRSARMNTKKELNNGAGAYDRVGTNSLCNRPLGGVKFGNRQREFTWTPNHIWHAKRFHMIKKWNFQIPFSPSQKCFRATSRAAREGTIAFDTSYYGSLVLKCPNADTIAAALREFTTYCGVVPQWLLEGRMAYNGWLYNEGQQSALISLCHDPSTFSLLIRLHPADFVRCFVNIKAWAVDREATVFDCRYALGSIELCGPTSLNSLSKILHFADQKHVDKYWRLLSQTSDPNFVPVGTLFCHFVEDPRFWKHPVRAPRIEGNVKNVMINESNKINGGNFEALSALVLLLSRTELYKDMKTVKLLNQEQSRLNPASTHIRAFSKIPILVYKLQSGAWCVTMPWFWTQPIWVMLMKVTLLKVGGYREMHQLKAEILAPAYPYDYPFTVAGYQDHQLNIVSTQLAHEKLPASKRACFEKTEGLMLPGCDWFYLRKWIFGLMLLKNKPQKETGKFSQFGEFDAENNRVLRSSEDLALIISSTRDCGKEQIPVTLFKANDPVHKLIKEGEFKPDVSKFPSLPVVQIALRPAKTGFFKDNARIHSLPEQLNSQNLIGFVSTACYNVREGLPTAIGLVSACSQDLNVVYVRNVGCTTCFAAKVTKL